MLSKIERFQQWRGSKSAAEQQNLDVALLISEYVNSVDNLGIIKAEAATKFRDFDQYKSRTLATAVFTKLFIDEAIAQLPETAAKEKAVLINLSTILTHLYDNWKNDPAKNIASLIDNIEQLIAIGTLPFTEKKQYKIFIFSSYLVFQITKLTLDNMDWSVQMMASLILNIEQMKLKMAYFLQKIEEKEKKLEQIDQREAGSNNVEHAPLKSIKDLLNKRYHKVLSNTPLLPERSKLSIHPGKKPIKRSILTSLAELETDIDKVSSGIRSLIEQKNEKAEIEAKIKSMVRLVSAAEENDRKITGRKYFLDFIESHSELYQALLANTDDSSKIQLIEKIEQLKKALASPDLSSGVINGLSWVAAPLTVVYRTAAPQTVQDVISSTLPTTLDSDCKAKLKELAQVCLSDLKIKLEKKERQIAAINNRFFHQDEKLKQLIADESSEQLAVLQKTNDAMKEAVQASSTLLVRVKENLHFLNDLKDKRETLKEFIRLHDVIFVKICNFLAQFFSFFKTETAQMIDQASILKNRVNKLAIAYQNAIGLDMRQIESNPLLDARTKSHIKRRFKAEEQEIIQEKQNRIAPNKQEVRLLMDNLSVLFTTKPHPVRGHPVEEEQVILLSCKMT